MLDAITAGRWNYLLRRFLVGAGSVFAELHNLMFDILGVEKDGKTFKKALL